MKRTPQNIRYHQISCGEAQESVAAFAAAYTLGEKESAAAVNLLRCIPKAIKEGLIELVRLLGLLWLLRVGNWVVVIISNFIGYCRYKLL